MLFYLTGYLVLLSWSFGSVLSIKEHIKARSSRRLFLFVLLLSTAAGLRAGVGKDYYNYLDTFRNPDILTRMTYLEPGFRFLVLLFKTLGFPEHGLFFLFALISLSLISTGIAKTSKYPEVSMLIYYCIFYIDYNFNAIRQGIVMGVFIWLISDIVRGNMPKVLVWSMISATIHSSGLFIMMAYFVSRIRLHPANLAWVTASSTVLIFFKDYLLKLMYLIGPTALQMELTKFMTRYGTSISTQGILQRLLLVILFLVFYRPASANDCRFERVLPMYLCGFVLYSLFSFEELLATRINMFFRVLEIILFPILLSASKNRFTRVLLFSVIVLWATLVLCQNLRLPYNYPFRTIFQ